jgi:arsenate reductase
MAEGFARTICGGVLEPYSAGLTLSAVNPRAVVVMKEAGIDISHQTSKDIEPQLLATMDIVVTLCGGAAEACPWTPPAMSKNHWPLENPAAATGSEEEIMTVFKKVRDEIRQRVEALVKETP